MSQHGKLPKQWVARRCSYIQMIATAVIVALTAATAWAHYGDGSGFYVSSTVEVSPTDAVAVGEPLSVTVTGYLHNQPNPLKEQKSGYGYSNFGVALTYSATGAKGTYGAPPSSTSYTASGFPSKLQSASTGKGTIVFNVPGYWKIYGIVTGTAWSSPDGSYNDAGDNTISATTSSTSTKNPAGNAPMISVTVNISEIDAKPNNSNSLNDTFIKQTGVVGVLDGWELQYKAKATPDPGANSGLTYQWQSTKHGTKNWADISGATGLTATATAAMGDYDIRVIVKGSNEARSATREVQVAKLNYNSNDFKIIHSSANYTRDPNNPDYVVAPAYTLANAIIVQGNLTWAQGSPHPANIGQSIIQGMEDLDTDENLVATGTQTTWASTAQSGDSISYSSTATVTNKYSGDGNWYNDASLNQYQYGGDPTASHIIGTAFSITDLPTTGAETFTLIFSNQYGTVNVSCEVSKQILKEDFRDWLCVRVANSNSSKPQYVSYGTVPWHLHIDTTIVPETSWTCNGGAAQAPSTPTNGTKTSIDPNKKSIITPGPEDSSVTHP